MLLIRGGKHSRQISPSQAHSPQRSCREHCPSPFPLQAEGREAGTVPGEAISDASGADSDHRVGDKGIYSISYRQNLTLGITSSLEPLKSCVVFLGHALFLSNSFMQVTWDLQSKHKCRLGKQIQKNCSSSDTKAWCTFSYSNTTHVPDTCQRNIHLLDGITCGGVQCISVM